MFGREWDEGTATVVASRVLPRGGWGAGGSGQGIEYVLDVETTDGQLFRAKTTTNFGHWHTLVEGQTVNVLYDAKRQAVQLAEDNRIDHRASMREQKQALDEIAAQPPDRSHGVEHAPGVG